MRTNNRAGEILNAESQNKRSKPMKQLLFFLAAMTLLPLTVLADPAPKPPTNVVAGPYVCPPEDVCIDTLGVTITWTDCAKNETSYLVESGIRDESGTLVWTVIATLPKNATEFSLFGDPSLFYRVSAVNKHGIGAAIVEFEWSR
jgi:hypothetical protein